MLTHKELHWFHLANAATYGEKRAFYALKDRILQTHGTLLGYATQDYPLQCWKCAGTGESYRDTVCWSCGGSGEYDVRNVFLGVYELQGRRYHVPFGPSLPEEMRGQPFVEHIEGKIQHEKTTSEIGRRCYLRLLLRLRPLVWHARVFGAFHRRTYRRLFRLARMRNRSELFPVFAFADEDTLLQQPRSAHRQACAP